MTGAHSRSRRRFLQLAGVTAGIGLTGCVEDESDDGAGDENGGEDANGMTGEEDGENGSEGGDGDGADNEESSEDDGDGADISDEEFMSDANNYDGTLEDLTGQDSVTIAVAPDGQLQYDPAGARITTGTTVTWEWEEGGHSVTAESGADFDSGLLAENGATFEQTFDSTGEILYFCLPHRAQGHKGVLEVVEADDKGGDGGDTIAGEEFMTDANNYDGTLEDLTGQDSVTIAVGPDGQLQYDPAGVEIDAGTTVTWEWKDGGHSVTAEQGADFASAIRQLSGTTFEQTFEKSGEILYFCRPHRSAGMKGALLVR